MQEESFFDEKIYVAANPDVANAIAAGDFASGREHYDTCGRYERRISSAHEFVLAQEERMAYLKKLVTERQAQVDELARTLAEREQVLETFQSNPLYRSSEAVRRRVRRLSPLAVFARRAAKVAWWTATLQLKSKLEERRILVADAHSPRKAHFAPPSTDMCYSVPFPYQVLLPEKPPKLAVICHMFYPEFAEEFKRYLANIPFRFDLFLTTDTAEKRAEIEQCFRAWECGAVEVRVVPNRGRDIAPKLLSCRDVYDRYEFFLHLHTKKSPQLSVLAGWRTYLLETLLGSPDIVKSVFEAFISDPRLGMVAAEHFSPVRGSIGWGWNFDAASKFARQLGIDLAVEGKVDFPSGSMFWGRSAAIKPLLDRALTLEDFPPEEKQLDGTLAHVIERLYFFVCEKAGYEWAKILRPELSARAERILYMECRDELRMALPAHQYGLLYSGEENARALDGTPPTLREDWRTLHAKSPLRSLDYQTFCTELRKHIARQDSLVEFDEDFYLSAHLDVAGEVARGSVSCGYAHFCLAGQVEGRLYSDHAVKRRFKVQPKYPSGFLAPVDFPPVVNKMVFSGLPDSPTPLLLVLFSRLQEDLFFAGYSEFFKDFQPVFARFKRVIIAVESATYEASLASRYAPNIEVMHVTELSGLMYKPDVVVGFSAHLTEMAHMMFPTDPQRIVYYCQDFESGFFPRGADYVVGEKSIAKTPNLIVSTELLRKFLVDYGLIRDQHVYVTRPRIEPVTVVPEKTKRLFVYYRPESFQKRNLPETVKDAAHRFCEKHTGFEIFMIGSVNTAYSYEKGGNRIYVVNKLPKADYSELISTCDVAVSMIYSAHPGVIAFQTAASGIPTITNVFDNRDADTLRRISDNLVPYDPVRDDLVKLMERALEMPKGKRSFNEVLYSGERQGSILEFCEAMLARSRSAAVVEAEVEGA
jgi:hypothetical protein